MKHALRLAALVAALALAGAQVHAQTPTAQELIEQLKPPATRSMGASRGFKVQKVDEPASAVVPVTTAVAAPASAPVAAAVTPPPAEAAPAPARAEPAPPPPSVSLSIEFDFNSARVRSDSLPVLNNLAQALKSPALKDARFRIEGHTDAAGRVDYNQRLSAQRAQAVSSLLAAQGVAVSRLSSVGKGSSELADAAHPTAASNRRVKIVNLD